MSNKNLSLLFTGQGSQHLEMGKDFIENYDWVKDRYTKIQRYWVMIYLKHKTMRIY